MASPFDQAFAPGYLDNAPVPQANVLQQVASAPAPVSSVPRTSAVNAWNDIGKALMMMSGPTSRQMVYDQDNHDLAMQQGQGQIAQNNLDLAKGQADMNTDSLKKMMLATPALEDAFNQGGAPAAQAAWEQLVPVLGIAPDKAAQFHQMLQSDPQGTINHMKSMIPQKDQGSQPGSIQEINFLKDMTPEQLAALKQDNPLAYARIEAMANPNAIKPVQQAQIDHNKRTEAIAAYRATHSAAQQAGAGWTPAAIDYAAQDVEQNGVSALRSIPASVRAAVIARAQERAAGAGTAGDAALAHADFKANAGTLTKLVPAYNQVKQYENSARDLGTQITSILGKGAANGQSPVLNRWIQAGRRSIAGDPEVTALDNYIRDYNQEIAKVISGTTNSSRAPTDTMNKTLHDMLNSSMNPAQIVSAITANNNAAGFRTSEMANQIQSVRGAMRSRPAASVGGSTPNPQAVDYLRKNPNLRAQFDAKYGAGAAARALGQ